MYQSLSLHTYFYYLALYEVFMDVIRLTDKMILQQGASHWSKKIIQMYLNSTAIVHLFEYLSYILCMHVTCLTDKIVRGAS